jgi:hypothetical protein
MMSLQFSDHAHAVVNPFSEDNTLSVYPNRLCITNSKMTLGLIQKTTGCASNLSYSRQDLLLLSNHASIVCLTKATAYCHDNKPL